MVRPVPISKREHAVANGYRSGLEERIADELRSAGCTYTYEELVIRYIKPTKVHTYTPDFVLANGIIIETKGRWLTADRQKHLLVQAQHPDLDIRFVFHRSKDRLSKQSNTTYADYCRKHGWLFADKSVPDAWLMEKPKHE